MSETGKKDDDGKLRFDLLPFHAVTAVVKVLTYGASKYGPENWRQVDNRRARYFAAALRHMSAWWLGEKLDPDTGENHLAHAACSLLFLLDEEEASSPKPLTCDHAAGLTYLSQCRKCATLIFTPRT